MKLTTILSILLATFLATAYSQERSNGIRSAFDSSLVERLDGKTEWRMDNGETLSFADLDGVTSLSGSERTIVGISRPEHLEQVVQSRGASCLLLRVMVERPSGGSNYSRLLCVRRDPNARWVAQPLFTRDAPPLQRLHRWISELGAISDSGRLALLKLGEASQEAGPYHMIYSWQTWQLDTPKKIADGIRLPDDFDK